MPSRLSEAAYAASQTARVAWYTGAFAVAQRLQQGAMVRPSAPRPTRPGPGWRTLLEDISGLFRRDLLAARRGLYPLPHDWAAPLVGELAAMARFMADVPEVARRRGAEEADEPFREHRGRRPRYYLQNFHFQSGGWMTAESAAIYDTQVEVLFSGAAAAMRRQAIPVIASHLEGRDQRRASLVDIAAGTGRWLKDLRPAFPALPVTLLDMSETYLARARRDLGRDGRRRQVVAAAEAMPFADGSQDVVTAIYLFHELPPKVRRAVAAEVARVLRPGGLFVLVDSIQLGEQPAYDGLLERFPASFHEPYYLGYCAEDLDGLFGEAGLVPHSRQRAFLSTVAAFRKP